MLQRAARNTRKLTTHHQTFLMQITQEQHQQLIELIEDSVEYYCDENRLSGELIYTIINAYSEAKLAQLRGDIT